MPKRASKPLIQPSWRSSAAAAKASSDTTSRPIGAPSKPPPPSSSSGPVISTRYQKPPTYQHPYNTDARDIRTTSSSSGWQPTLAAQADRPARESMANPSQSSDRPNSSERRRQRQAELDATSDGRNLGGPRNHNKYQD